MTNVLQALFICVGIIASLTLQAEQNGIIFGGCSGWFRLGRWRSLASGGLNKHRFNPFRWAVRILSYPVIASLTLQAEQNGIYRWTDNNGVTQYSDRPPEGVESVFVKTSTKP